MLNFISTVLLWIGMILGYIVSYHVVESAAPQYLGMWWTSFWIAIAAGVFGGLAKFYDE